MSEAAKTDWKKIAKRIRVPLGFVFGIAFVFFARPTPEWLVAGGVVALLGVAIRAYASGYVNKNEELAMSGPYAYTRNPLYLGSVVIGVGMGIASRNVWIAVAMVVMYLVIYIPVIRGEEEFLTAKFAEFASYKSRVPRLFPRLTPARVGDSSSQSAGSFSRELYLKHREYNALIGTVLLIGVLAVKLLWFSR